MEKEELWHQLFQTNNFRNFFMKKRMDGVNSSDRFFYKKYPIAFVPHPLGVSEVLPPEMLYTREDSYFELTMVFHGTCFIAPTGRKMFELREGDAILTGLHTIKRVERRNEDDAILNCLLKPEFFDHSCYQFIHNEIVLSYLIDGLRELLNPNDCLIFRGSGIRGKEFFWKAVHIYLSNQTNACVQSSLFILLLLSELIQGEIEIYVERDIGSSQDTLIQRIISYISKHCQSVTLQSVADEFGYNKAYLSDLLRQKSGLSYTQHLQKAKLDYAKRLLKSTNKSVDEIAFLSGYDNPGYFYRCFKKEFHMTPSEYRLS